jgi:hypothetical protein
MSNPTPTVGRVSTFGIRRLETSVTTATETTRTVAVAVRTVREGNVIMVGELLERLDWFD